MAWSTALGNGLQEVWQRLLAGHTGLRELRSAHPLRSRLAAPVRWPPRSWDHNRRQVELASRTAGRALRHAGLDARRDQPWLVAGTSYGALLDDPVGVLAHEWVHQAAGRMRLATTPVSISTACSSGADAIATAAALVAAGAARACVCGGVDILTPAKRLGHTAMGTMSPTRLRPFDRQADGTLLGEAAAFLVLESAHSARRRGATAHAVLLGYGAANDAVGLTAPDPTGDSIACAIERALAAAGRDRDDVAVVNAHGSGTVANDQVEAACLARVFPGDRRPIVFATKAAFGHTLGATGAVEAVALIHSLRHRVVPAIHGLTEPRPALATRVPRGRPVPIGPGVGASLTLGFGGFNTCLVLHSGGPLS